MESEFVAWLHRRLPANERLLLGIGDDAALVRLGGTAGCLVSIDVLTEGVDFRLSEVDPRRIGRKALAVNLSDIAAMAGTPVAAVAGVVLPRAGGMALAQALVEGMIPLAERYDLALAGGDTNTWDGPLVISITILGQPTARGPLTRSGAKAGDRIIVTGSFGGSILGHQFDFEPRVREALTLHKRYALHAGIDCSDGLSLDLSRLAAASGCGAIVDLAAVPIAPAAVELTRRNADGQTELDHALADGEDFELILAVPPEAAEQMLAEQPLDVPLSCIGEFIAEPGLWQQVDGHRRPLVPRGFLH